MVNLDKREAESGYHGDDRIRYSRHSVDSKHVRVNLSCFADLVLSALRDCFVIKTESSYLAGIFSFS